MTRDELVFALQVMPDNVQVCISEMDDPAYVKKIKAGVKDEVYKDSMGNSRHRQIKCIIIES